MKSTKRFAALFASAAMIVAACSGGGAASESPAEATPEPTQVVTPAPVDTPVEINFWTKEGEASLEYVKSLAAGYTAEHPNVTFKIENKDVETLRQDFQTASLANTAPDLLWTVADHVGPFTAADLIMPLDGMIDTATYLPNALAAVQADGKTWGVPISYGNQLMLYWNKSLAGDTAPADSDALAAKAKELTSGKKYGLTFNQTESFWLVPFLGGFGGRVFAEDGKTPTLDTEAMVGALQLLYDWKFTDKILPTEADYAVADSAFKDGSSAFIINGDWAMADYSTALGDKLGVGPIPMITGHEMPKPYTAGAFYMVPKGVAGSDKEGVVLDFIKWSTSKEQQLQMVSTLKRLPGNNEAINDAAVTGDPLLGGAAAAVKEGIPQPTNLEMRCVFDSMTAGVRNLFGGKGKPADIAKAMQESADKGVAPGGECAE